MTDVQSPPLSQLADLIGSISRLLRFLERSVGPLLDMLIRLTLAQTFFISAVVKLANWNTAVYLAREEYPVSWMNADTAAFIGIAIELVGAVLVASGLATRAAALALGLLALMIQFSYQAHDLQLFWAMLLFGLVIRGAGPLSLDHLLARGLANSAVPFAAPLLRLIDELSRYVKPIFDLLLRFWLAMAIFATAAGVKYSMILPLAVAADVVGPAALVAATALVLGLSTRLGVLLLLFVFSTTNTMAGVDSYPYWCIALAIPLVFGPGPLSLDWIIDSWLRRRYPQIEGKPAFSLEGLPRVAIVGAGFGGIACASALTRARVDVTLIDRHNYHLFQPLLYQVATASLSPGDIATPVRSLFRDFFNVRVLFGEVTGVDKVAKRLRLGTQEIPYDFLVLATGAAHSYFGRDEWAPFAPGLKCVEDATDVRRRLLTAFERAESCEDEQERRALLTFLVVGGGPTGVELAGAIAELSRLGMDKEFRRFDPADARIILIQAGPRLLPTFPDSLSVETTRSLEKIGVEVILNSRVENIDQDGVVIHGERIAARTVLWAAGVVASPAARWLEAEADNAGRVKVGTDLSIPGLPDVFAIGDTALSMAWKGSPVPGLAPAAKQAGEYVAQVISRRCENRRPPPPFVYRHLGSLATIGRKSAVADFGFIRLYGVAAWWLWGWIHVAFLIGLRNRMSVMFDWFWSYLTYRSGTRLITGQSNHARD